MENYSEKGLAKLKNLYKKVQHSIVERLFEFKTIWQQQNHFRIFQEFVFCLLTPQSKAKNAWQAVISLTEHNTLIYGTEKEIQPFLKGVRFYKNKAHYIVLARELYYVDKNFKLISLIKPYNIKETRNTLVKIVKGYGYKEASHFLRNIGLYEQVSILDRHIMRNMKNFGFLKEIPKTLTKKQYLEIENAFFAFSSTVGIPPHELDLLLWYKEAGEVFK